MTDLNIYSKEQTDNLLSAKANVSALTGKQDTLVSGTNIKTVNGNSLLGSGDITVGGGSAVNVAKIKDFGWGSSFITHHSGFDSTKVGIAYEIDGVEYVDTVRRITATFITTNGIKSIDSVSAETASSGLTVTELRAALSSAGVTSSILSSTEVIRLYISTNKSVGSGYTTINNILSIIGKNTGSDATTSCDFSIDQKVVL